MPGLVHTAVILPLRRQRQEDHGQSWEGAQWLRIYYATEDRRLEPSTHARWPTNTFNFSCKGSDSIFWLPQAPKYTQAYMPRCKLKTKINLKKKRGRI